MGFFQNVGANIPFVDGNTEICMDKIYKFKEFVPAVKKERIIYIKPIEYKYDGHGLRPARPEICEKCVIRKTCQYVCWHMNKSFKILPQCFDQKLKRTIYWEEVKQVNK